MPQIHQGTTTFTSFYLFFAGTFLLTMSCTLLSSGVWCLLVRLPVVHLVHGPARILVALTGYTVATAVFMLPASCILYRQHNVTRSRRPLFQVIALLSICTIFLTCCASHAIVYRKSAYSDLEDSMTVDSDPVRLQCCSLNVTLDHLENSTTSASERFCNVSSNEEDDNSGGKTGNASSQLGCLDAITLDLMWITAYILGLCFIGIFVDVLVILSIGVLLKTANAREK